MSEYCHPYDAVINLGRDCQPTFQLRKHRLQMESQPLDHIWTSFGDLCRILSANFEGYTDPDNFVFIANSEEKYIKDIRYNTKLIHDLDLTPEFMTGFAAFKEKYDRRIARLQNVLANSSKVLFIRKGMNFHEALELEELLATLYPHLEFKLVALGSTDDIIINLQRPRIEFFYLKQPEPYVWSGDTEAWATIFRRLQLIP